MLLNFRIASENLRKVGIMSEVSKHQSERVSVNESSVPLLHVSTDDNCRSLSHNKHISRIQDDVVHIDGRDPVEKVSSQRGDLEALPTLLTVTRRTARIGVRSSGKILLLDPHEVISVEAQGNYVMLRRQTDSHMLRESISVAAEKLKPYGLVRIHRSVLVNKSYIMEILPLRTGDYVLRLKGGKEYTVTRTYKKRIRDFADTWIGLDAFADRI
jgi:DNA-binding LytR/AlgR family response regulator